MPEKLTPQLILAAYRAGMFPMGDSRNSKRLLWFSPDPRCILEFDRFHIPRSLKQVIRRGTFEVRVNTAFEQVIDACGDRPEGTWINKEIRAVYLDLHRAGFVHSVESWIPAERSDSAGRQLASASLSEPDIPTRDDAPHPRPTAHLHPRPIATDANGCTLAGGLYGVSIGGAFFGESMFFRVPDASKVALVALMDRVRQRGFTLVDIQWPTPHLEMFGAVEIPRDEYLQRLEQAVQLPCTFDNPPR